MRTEQSDLLKELRFVKVPLQEGKVEFVRVISNVVIDQDDLLRSETEAGFKEFVKLKLLEAIEPVRQDIRNLGGD